MSGGIFDYMQYHIGYIADKIEDEIKGHDIDEKQFREYDNQHKKGWIDDETYNYIKEYRHTPPPEYSEETLEAFKDGYKALRMAEIYAQRIDWLLSGDDGEESFHSRLVKDIGKLKKELDTKWKT